MIMGMKLVTEKQSVEDWQIQPVYHCRVSVVDDDVDEESSPKGMNENGSYPADQIHYCLTL